MILHVVVWLYQLDLEVELSQSLDHSPVEFPGWVSVIWSSILMCCAEFCVLYPSFNLFQFSQHCLSWQCFAAWVSRKSKQRCDLNSVTSKHNHHDFHPVCQLLQRIFCPPVWSVSYVPFWIITCTCFMYKSSQSSSLEWSLAVYINFNKINSKIEC